LWQQHKGGNQFLVTRPTRVTNPEGVPFCFTRCLGDNDAFRGHAYYVPFAIKEPAKGVLPANSRPNLSEEARAYLKAIGSSKRDDGTFDAEPVWLHTLAIGFSPRYLSDNADGLTIDWPRIPLPNNHTQLDNTAALGRRLAALLDTEREVPGVTAGSITEYLRVIGSISATDLKMTAGWGHTNRQGSVYPGQGNIKRRDWSKAERQSLDAGFTLAGLSEERALELLGRPIDIFLNNSTCWRAVPEHVWQYYIGGYQVIKKWLSYREEAVLGRALTRDEAREVTAMVRRLASIVLMGDELDANYTAVLDNAFQWRANQ
jgi:hypothetical protein